MLPLAAALGRDPRKDVDWDNASDSYFRLREQLRAAARFSCQATEGTAEVKCVIREEAAMLNFPAAAGSYCASRTGHEQRCLDALVILAVYLEALKTLNSSPL